MANALEVEIHDGVARLTLDDGKVNALSRDVLDALVDALDEAQRAEAVVVLRGRPGIFSAGFDLKTFQQGASPTLDMVRAGARTIERLLSYPHPVLTVCTGHAYPMGAFLMLASDSRIGVAGEYAVGMNEVAIGITVPGFAMELARHRLTPPGLARVSTASMFTPVEAMRLGYLDRVVPTAALDASVEDEVRRLVALHAGSFSATKLRANDDAIRAVREAAARELESAASLAPLFAGLSSMRGGGSA